MSKAPLTGLKVVDFSVFVAAPVAACSLGAMGADVIKVEPIKGDPYRTGGLVFGMPAEDGLNPLYDTVNSYKRFISLDLRTQEGQEAMKKLLAETDVFVTNYRPAALAGIGIDYENIKKINPRIIYAQMNGYGFKGEEKDRAGYDSTAFMSRSGYSFLGAYTKSAPMITPAAAGDVMAAYALLAGIMGAIVKMKETGEGEHVTTSLYASAVWARASPLTRYQFMECKDSWPGNPDFMALSADYQCKDGRWVRFCSMGAEKSWPPTCNALGLNEYLDDPRFNTSVEILKNTEACYALIQSKVKEKTKQTALDYILSVSFPKPFEKQNCKHQCCKCKSDSDYHIWWHFVKG